MKSIFRDKTKIVLQAGNGGNGGVSFAKNKKPDGGIGGDGGSIFLEGDSHLYHFKYQRFGEIYKAEDGMPGRKNNRYGENGNDLVIKVPLGTRVYIENSKNYSFEILEHGQRVLITQGGKGGSGNFTVKNHNYTLKDSFKPGTIGQTYTINLELQMLSDILLIGLPNAGKSSIISSITNAKSLIGEYAFTTIYPVLGEMDGIRLLDLPGLVEGTHEGKGLGISFEKHTRHSKVVAHVISLEENVLESYKKIRSELAEISSDLANKPEVVVLNKIDCVEESEIKKQISALKKLGIQDIFLCTTLDDAVLENLKNWFKEMAKKYIV